MTAAWWLVVLCGCGRLGFDNPSSRDDAANDGVPDDATMVGTDTALDSVTGCDGVNYRIPVDSFEGSDLTETYTTFTDNGTLLATQNGVLRMQLGSNAGNAYVGAYSRDRRVFRDIAVVVELTMAPASVLGAQTSFYVGSTAEHVGLRFDSGTLYVIPSGPNLAFDPTAHRWLRIREAQGTVTFEARSSSGPWTTLYAQATPAWTQTALTQVRFEAGTFQSVANPGEAHFDNLNMPPCP